MSLKDYCKPRDKFKAVNKHEFPCNVCKHDYKGYYEEPCIRCDHNVNAVPEKEPAKGCGTCAYNPKDGSHYCLTLAGPKSDGCYYYTPKAPAVSQEPSCGTCGKYRDTCGWDSSGGPCKSWTPKAPVRNPVEPKQEKSNG